MHCKLEKIELDPMSISPDKYPLVQMHMYSVDIAPYILPNSQNLVRGGNKPKKTGEYILSLSKKKGEE